jgi:hypothetical protein
MAITAISISQDNTVGGSNLLAAQSPVVFIADCTYTGVAPDECIVEVRDINGNVLETYRAIPYADPLINVRQFIFKASSAIKALLGSFDEFAQLDESLVYVEGLTLNANIRFVSPDDELVFDEVLIDFAHASRQFGEGANMQDQFNNDNDIYYAAKDGVVYVYFYNDDPTNQVAIDGPVFKETSADSNIDVPFQDNTDENYTIFVIE